MKNYKTNIYLGGYMKKIILLIFILISSMWLWGADPELSQAGMSNTSGGGSGTFSTQAGATVYVKAVGNGSGGTLQANIHDDGASTNNKLYIYYYSDTPPSTYKTYKEVTASSFSVDGNNLTFQFTMPADDSNTTVAQSIQIYFGLIGQVAVPPPPTTNYGTAQLTYSLNNAPTGYQSYMTYSADTSTETPTLTNPAADSYDNDSVHLNITIPETASSGTVKLRIETDSSGSPSGTEFNTLTLVSDHEDIGTDDFYINGADLTDNTQEGDAVDDVSSVSTANTSLTDGTVYHWRLQYQDSVGNPVAATSFHKFTYDTSITAASGISASDGSGSFISVSYSLPEQAGDNENTNGTGEVVVIIKDTSGTEISTITLEDASVASSGSHSITLDGSDFSASTYYLTGTGANSLTSGTDYRFYVSYKDRAGNGPSTSSYSQITYTTDSSTTQPIMDSASQNSGGHDFVFQFDLPEDALDNSVKIFIDTANDHNGSEGQIQLSGTYNAGNNQTVTLTLDTSTNQFDTSDGDIDSITNSTSLTNGTTYYVSISYQDASGNAASVSGGTVTFVPDLATRSDITLSAPTADSYVNGSFDVTYLLPETATDGTVKLYFYNDSGLTSIRSILTLVTGSSLNNTTSHTITLDPTGLSSAVEVASYDGSYSNTLVDNADMPEDYYFVVEYQDQYGNTATQSSSNIRFYFDDTTKAFSSAPTFSDLTSDDDVQVTYSLPEDASELYVYFYDTTPLLKGKKLSQQELARLLNAMSRSELSRALRSKLTIADISDYYSSGSHTLTLDASNFVNDADVSAYSSNNSLVDGTTYYVTVEYADLASNAVATSSNSGTDSYDAGTEVPTMSSASELADANGPKLRVSYNLPESGLNQTVKILICNSNNSSDVHTTVTLDGHNSSGDSGNIDLDVPFVTSDSDVYDVVGTADLSNNTTYYAFVQYQDAAGNSAATSTTSQSFTWDNTTETPTLSLPEDNGYDNASLIVNVTYPETEYTNSLKLYISDHVAKSTNKDLSRVRASMTLTLTGITSGSDFTLDGSDLSASNNTNISATSGLFSLVSGSQYDVYFGYRDSYGNDQAVSATHTFTYDTSAASISISSPSNNTTVTGDFSLVYTKSEAATNGTFKIMFDHATDNTKDATLTMNNTYCGYTAQQTLTVDVSALSSTTGVSSVTGAATLADGETYTIKMYYDDLAGNSSAVSSIDITYNTTTTTLTISKVDVSAGSPLNGNLSDWQPVACFKAETNTSTATISSFKVVRLGSNATSDFETNAVALFESTDSSFDSSSDTNLGSKTFATDWTWNSGFNSVGSGTDDRYYFFCVDVASGFNLTHTIGGRVANGDVTSDASQTINNPSGNLDSELKYLDGDVYVAGEDPTSGGIGAGETDIPILQVNMKTNQGTTNLTGIKFDVTCNNTSDITNWKLYHTTSNTFGTSTQLATTTPVLVSGNDYTLTFSGFSESIGSTLSDYFWVAIDTDASASPTTTVQISLPANDSGNDNSYIVEDAPYNIFLDNDNTTFSGITGDVHTLPVELSSFTATNVGRKVILEWVTQSETENQGFNIWRSNSQEEDASNGAFKVNPNFINGAVNSSTEQFYSFEDDYRINYGETYWYWIETIDLNQVSEFVGPISYTPIEPDNGHGSVGELIYGLQKNYPNPFNPTTTISFALKNPGKTTLTIYNAKGQRVSQIFDGYVESDVLHTVQWHGKDDNGNAVSSGVYFYKIESGKYSEMKRMLLIK